MNVRKATLCLIIAVLMACALVATLPGSAEAAPEVGQAEAFWTLDWKTGEYSQIAAKAGYVGEHAAVYVQSGVDISDFLVSDLGTSFDTVVYPALTQAFGSEPNPGIDGDPRVVLLIYDFEDPRNNIDGSFNPRDVDPDSAWYSNRREMVYLNSKTLQREPSIGPALAAHEFAHLIVYYRDAMLDPSPDAVGESTWLTEGFTTYGEYLAGYDNRTAGQLLAFTRDPNYSLTHWQGLRANYGASYSFMRYLAERHGEGFIRALVEQPLDGVAGIDAALASVGSPDTFASLFDDWVLAGLLDAQVPQLPPYLFTGLSVSIAPAALIGTMPVQGNAQVVDYGAVYLDFPAALSWKTFQAVIDGDPGAPLQAALVSWDSTGLQTPLVQRFDLANPAVGGTVTGPAGYDRHTLAVWARGVVGSTASHRFLYSGAPDPPASTQFLDMAGDDVFYPFVAKLLSRRVISGKEIPAGSGLWFFMGRDDVLRAQFAKMIMEATGLHTGDVDNVGNPTFSDVPSVFDANGYPYDYIEEAAALGIVSGFNGGTFHPYSPITRAQLVLMITRGAAAAGKPLPAYAGSDKVFADVPLSHPYYQEIMTAYTAGILSGSPGTGGRLYFHPYASASRNHVAKMTANLVGYLEED
jgi:hypothetical protein